MAKRGARNKDLDELSGLLNSYVDIVNATSERLTGKTIAAWLEEIRQRPIELPPGESAAPSQSGMPLADAYAILGLKPDAPPGDVKKHYRRLAHVFHSDKGGMNDEAMKLLNRAYERITKKKGGE
ncbi:hypothetical protein ES703_69779 [subsurface metagenome]